MSPIHITGDGAHLGACFELRGAFSGVKTRRGDSPCRELIAIVSYLTARPSRDLVQRAHQQLTRRWRTEAMAKDAIVEEVRRIRQQYAARFNYDVAAIFRDLQARQERGEFAVVTRKPRRARVQPATQRRRAV